MSLNTMHKVERAAREAPATSRTRARRTEGPTREGMENG
jgi:hypothetical protein